MRTSILEDLDVYPRTSRRPSTTPSTAKSHIGDFEFGYESFALSTDPGLVMLVYTVEPGSPSADALGMLASWAAPSAVDAAMADARAERPGG